MEFTEVLEETKSTLLKDAITASARLTHLFCIIILVIRVL